MPFLSHLSSLYGALGLELVAATSKKTSSSGGSFIFVLLIIVLGAYLLFGRRRRRAQMGAQQQQISIGDEVVTTSGIIGRVEFLSDDRAHLTIAPDTTIEVVRAAIARRIDPVVPPSDEVAEAEYGAPYGAPEPEPEHDAGEHPADGPDDAGAEGSS